jgi:uncharacterized protein
MLRFVGRVFAAGLMLVAGASQAQVVISQVYGGGGNTGAPYNRDFIELHNNGTSIVSLGGLSLQYSSATGTGNFAVGSILPTVDLAPGQYYLVGSGATSATVGAPLPTVDASGTSSMSGTGGKVVLVNGTSALACNGSSTPCSGAQLAQIVDLVGFGSANFFEGSAATPAPSNTTSVLRAGNGCTDTNNNGADFTAVAPTPRNTASPLQGCAGGGLPLLAVSDVSAFEGDSGTTELFFGFGLNQPAGPGGVSIDYTTADGTATAGSDYVATSGTVVIAEGDTSAVVSVFINGDTVSEPEETFFVRATSATGATIADGEGLGTIQNDDVTVVSIPQIQGSGLISPLNGVIVTTEGIVTAQKFNNGFFLQAANDDGDPATSEGIFIFTSTAPPSTATVGNLVRVTGTVTEFTPSTNLNQLSITEIGFVSAIQVLSTGNALPAPVALTSTDFNAMSNPGTAEKYEGMRVTLPSALVIAGSDGNISEANATSTTNGVFQVVLSDVGRPFREPGIGILDTIAIPGGKNPPRFDTNQERLMVRSRGQIGATSLALDVDTEITDMTGVLDYYSGTWAVLPDAGSGTINGGKVPTAVADTKDGDITIGGFNLLRFFDEVNDSNGAPTLTAAALDKRLTKTGAAICDYLKTPDILGVVEVENLRVLGLLADRINANCASAPDYVPYLVQGNDVGGINVGFLVSNRSVGADARVEVLEVVQYGKDTVLTNPDNSTSLLNDRPPLMLRAIVHHANGAAYPVTVIVNHLRSLNGIDDTAAGSSGWPTGGERVRTKRAQQAVFLADLVEARQQANPSERIVLLGDFNAFEFNDGYADVMGIVRGDEVPADEVFTYLPSPITTPMVDGSELIADPAERYSYVFEGNAQTLDHVIVNEALLMDAAGLEVDHARINADFGVHHYGEVGNAIRVSDHDPVRLRITVAGFTGADLGVTASASPSSVNPGDTVTYTAIATNSGPDDAASASIALVFDALVSPTVNVAAGWTCAAPVQASGTTTVTCTTATFTNGDSASFIASIVTDASLSGRNLQMAAAVASQTNDPANGNNSASASVGVRLTGNANMSVSLLGGPVTDDGITAVGPARVDGQVVFVIPVRNIGPDFAIGAHLELTGDVPLDNTALIIPNGWNCSQDATAGGFEMICDLNRPLQKISGEFFALGIVVPNRTGNLTVDAAVSSLTADPVAANNTAHRAFPIAGATVAGPTSVSQPAIPGSSDSNEDQASGNAASGPVARPDVQPTGALGG